MTYSELKDLCELRRIQVNDITRHIGMTYQGFKTSMENGKLASDKVVLLCKELGISPNTFFGWEKLDPVTYIESKQVGNNNVQNIMSTVDVLRDQLIAKDKQIAAKDQQIAELFAMLKNR